MGKKSVKEKVIHSFEEVDLTAIAIPSIAVYQYPLDYPDKYVARVYAGSSPTNIVMIADSAKEIQKDIETVYEGELYVFCKRMQGDPGSLVGTYIL